VTVGGAELATLEDHTFPVSCVRFSDDGRYLATCACAEQPAAGPSEIKVWDVASGKVLAARTGKGRIFSLVFSPDGRLLACGGQEGVLTVVDWKSPGQGRQVQGHQGDVSGLAFSPDGQVLASAGMEDRTVKVWKVHEILEDGARPWHSLAAPL